MPNWVKIVLGIMFFCLIVWAITLVIPDSINDPSTLDAANGGFPK